jgi:hypothetical protein
VIWTGFVGFGRSLRFFLSDPLRLLQLAFWRALKMASLPVAEVASRECDRLAHEIAHRAVCRDPNYPGD